MKLLLILVLTILSNNVFAGFTEYQLLNITGCKKYLISTDIPAPDGSSDGAWGVSDGNGYASAGLCEEEFHENLSVKNISLRKLKSFKCTADPKSPFRQLSCKSNSNPWYADCTIEGKANHVIRLYWTDTSSYEHGGSSKVNKSYVQDYAQMKKNCDAKK